MSRRLTDKQEYALSLLVFAGGKLFHGDWYSHYRIHRNTTGSLLEKGFVIRSFGEGFRITDKGRKVLAATPPGNRRTTNRSRCYER